jgi:hypothetical protein
LAVINNIVILARGTNTPLFIGISILLSTSITGLNVPLIDPRKRSKYITPYLKRFIGEDELIYLIFRGLLEAKLQTDAQAINRELSYLNYIYI